MFIVLLPLHRLPWSEFATVDFVTDFQVRKGTVVFLISSYSTNINKLSKPYSDNCINYASFGYQDKFDSIRKCLNQGQMDECDELSDAQLFTVNDTLYSDQVISWIHRENRNVWEECLDRYSNDDCNKENMFTVVYDNH